MKEIVILSCWPSEDYREKLLVEQINKIKSFGREILIATHYPIPDYIVKMVDYYIYDKKNEIYSYKDLDTIKDLPDYTVDFQSFKIEGVNISHSVALSRIFNIALNFVNNLGYKYFIIIEADTEYTTDNYRYIFSIKDKMMSEDKKIFFFKLRPYEFDYWETHGMYEIYETIIFGGVVNEFLNRFVFPQNVEEWNTKLIENEKFDLMEHRVTQAFIPYKKDCLILDSVRHTFPGILVNKTSVIGYDGLYYDNKTNRLILLLWNPSDKKIYYTIEYKTTGDRYNMELNQNCWWYIDVPDEKYNQVIVINLYDENGLLKTINHLIDDNFLETIKKRKRIKFN